MASGHRSDMLKAIRRAKKHGCTIEKRGSGHWRVTCPNGAVISAPFSPKTPGALRDFMKALDKEGVKL